MQPLIGGAAVDIGKAPQWNFHKYLIDKTGKVQSFESATEPSSPVITRAIDAALAR